MHFTYDIYMMHVFFHNSMQLLMLVCLLIGFLLNYCCDIDDIKDLMIIILLIIKLTFAINDASWII